MKRISYHSCLIVIPEFLLIKFLNWFCRREPFRLVSANLSIKRSRKTNVYAIEVTVGIVQVIMEQHVNNIIFTLRYLGRPTDRIKDDNLRFASLILMVDWHCFRRKSTTVNWLLEHQLPLFESHSAFLTPNFYIVYDVPKCVAKGCL